MFIDSNCLNDLFRLRPGRSIDNSPFFKSAPSTCIPPPARSALEVARGDAAMDVLPGLVVLLAARITS